MCSSFRLFGFFFLLPAPALAVDYLKRSEVPKNESEPYDHDPTVAKSFGNSEDDPIIDYCTTLTIKQQPLQIELMNETLENVPRARMMGAPEVLTLGENFIHLIGGKRIIDIGTFTGASALAWAVAAGEGGKVYTLDISMENFKKYGVPIISKDKDLFKRIIPVEAPALETLDRFIAEGLSGTFDFAFLDADKINNWNYYERCLKLLRKGGVILIDNALIGGKVARDPSTFGPDLRAIDEMNRKIFNDDRTYSALLNSGDGIHIAFKK